MKNNLYYPQVSLSDKQIFNEIKKETKEIGYYSLPFIETSDLKTRLDNLNFKQKQIAIIGIGGSTLGTYAIYNFIILRYWHMSITFFIQNIKKILTQSSAPNQDIYLFKVIS